jgi:predicted XRE-type DNA-binding protein
MKWLQAVFSMIWAYTIIDYMQANKFTQQQTADAMGVQRSRIADVRRGKRE